MANTSGKKYGGREKGTPNRMTKELRSVLKDVLYEEIEALQERLDALKPKERVELVIKLMPYALPKVTSVSHTTNEPFQSNGLEFLKLFPNPSNGKVTLEYYLPKNMDGAVAKVYDMVGRLVWIQAIEREEGMQQTDLNLNSLQKGNYVVIISAGNNSGEQLINHKLLILK